MKKIILVDDHEMFREGLADILMSEAEFQVVGQAGTAREAIELAHFYHPDLVLMDIGLPDETGIVATEKIIEENPETIVVFLTVFDTDDALFAAIRSGAKGYLHKSISSRDLIASLRSINRSEAAISRRMTRRILDEFSRLGPRHEPGHSRLADLTLREFDIIKEMALGSTNREIAQHYSISESTVKNHIHSILSKLELKNRTEVVRFALHQGIIDRSELSHSHGLKNWKDKTY